MLLLCSLLKWVNSENNELYLAAHPWVSFIAKNLFFKMFTWTNISILLVLHQNYKKKITVHLIPNILLTIFILSFKHTIPTINSFSNKDRHYKIGYMLHQPQGFFHDCSVPLCHRHRCSWHCKVNNHSSTWFLHSTWSHPPANPFISTYSP